MTTQNITQDKYKYQRHYSKRHKDKIALYNKKRYLKKYIDEILEVPIIKEYINDTILEESIDWYSQIDSSKIRGYKVTVKFKTILFLLMVHFYHYPLFYHEFQIHHPIKHTQTLKSKLLREYNRLYRSNTQNKFKLQPLHPIEYLPRFQHQFNFSPEIIDQAKTIIIQTRKEFEFSNPKTFLGAVFFHIANEHTTQIELADFLGITPNGIRGVHRKLKKILQK